MDGAAACDKVVARSVVHWGRDERCHKPTLADFRLGGGHPADRVQRAARASGVTVRVSIARVDRSRGDDHARFEQHAISVEAPFVNLVDVRGPGGLHVRVHAQY